MSALAGLVTALVLAQASPTGADCLVGRNIAGLSAAYSACVRASAKRLERSGEAADNVAVAAVVACRTEGRAAVGAIADCFQLDAVTLLRDTETEMHSNAVSAVVEIRANRHSPRN